MITHFVSNAIIVEVSSRERNILRTCLCIKLGTWWAWVNKHYKSTPSMKTHSSILLCRDSGRFQETWSVHQVALVVTSSAKCMNVATIRDLPQSRMWVCPSGVQLESQCHYSWDAAADRYLNVIFDAMADKCATTAPGMPFGFSTLLESLTWSV